MADLNKASRFPQQNLGSITSVPVREVWKDESLEFTPWLSQKENLDLLGSAIGIYLDSQTTEHPVGKFSADIRCKETGTDTWVVIENQLEETDHSHLGQLLTYAAGIGADTAIWVATRVREEHREAVNWLNQNTADKLSLFAVEIELLRIGDSPVAPRFHVVCKPNMWARAERNAAQELSVGRRTLMEYWNQFADLILRESKVLRPRKVSGSQYMTFSMGGLRGCRLMASALPQDKLLRVYLTLEGESAKDWLDKLAENQPEIEAAIGAGPLTWSERGTRGYKVYAEKSADPLVQEEWESQQRWIFDLIHRFYDVFAPRLRHMPVTAFSAEKSEEDDEAEDG